MFFDLEAKLKGLQELRLKKRKVKTGDNQERMNAPTGSATLTNSSSTLYLHSGALNSSRMTGGDSQPPPSKPIMNGQHAVPQKGEYMFT